MVIDPTVSLEGVATSLALLGAAVGYLLNLIKSWKRERRDRKLRGVKMTILEILDKHFAEGLHESAIWKQYKSDDGARTFLGAMTPGELTDLGFLRELRQLQLEGLIELIGEKRYRVRSSLHTEVDSSVGVDAL